MAYLIGIDCGKHTGIAIWDTETQAFTVIETFPIHRALDKVYKYGLMMACGANSVKVYFEDARQRRWFPKEASWGEVKGRAMLSGYVKRDAVIWQDALTDWGIPFEMVPPRPGMTKWDAATFARVTGYKGRTSNHARDAALLVFGRK